MKNEVLITEFLTLVKTNPTVTLTQYNNWLAKKQWYEVSIIRYFVYTLAMGIAKHHGVTLANYTENTIFTEVRDWLSETEWRKINKVIFNN